MGSEGAAALVAAVAWARRSAFAVAFAVATSCSVGSAAAELDS